MRARLAVVGLAFFAIFAIGAIGCGGKGSSTGNAGPAPLSCGVNFRTPNYVTANDPNNGQPNQLLYWPSFPVRIYFVNEVTATYNGVTYSTTDLFWEAANRWTSATSGGASFTTVNSSAAAQIIVNVNQLTAPPGNGGTLGFTHVTYFQSSRQLVKADITINVWPNMTREQFVDGLRRTTLHEFGHALFLQGHSDKVTDIMYPSSPSNQDGQLSQADINSILTTYCGNFGGSPVVARGRAGEEPVTITIE